MRQSVSTREEIHLPFLCVILVISCTTILSLSFSATKTEKGIIHFPLLKSDCFCNLPTLKYWDLKFINLCELISTHIPDIYSYQSKGLTQVSSVEVQVDKWRGEMFRTVYSCFHNQLCKTQFIGRGKGEAKGGSKIKYCTEQNETLHNL